MAKQLDEIAEARFREESMRIAYENQLTLASICKMDAKQLADGGYGATQDEAILTHVRMFVKQAERRANAFLASQN